MVDQALRDHRADPPARCCTCNRCSRSCVAAEAVDAESARALAAGGARLAVRRGRGAGAGAVARARHRGSSEAQVGGSSCPSGRASRCPASRPGCTAGRSVAVAVAADAVGAVAARAVAERRAAWPSSALHCWVASHARSFGQVSLSGWPACTLLHVPALPGDVARLALAVALSGGLCAADAVDAVTRLAARRSSTPHSPRCFHAPWRSARYSQNSEGAVGRVLGDGAAEQVASFRAPIEHHLVLLRAPAASPWSARSRSTPTGSCPTPRNR